MIKCFGIVPIKFEPRGISVMLVLHNAGHWGLPKGHPNEGESPKETAQRELKEESGLDVDEWLEYPEFSEHYEVEGEPKEVCYFVATVSGEIKPQIGEVRAIKWVGLEELEKSGTFPSHQKMLREITQTLLRQ